MFRLTGLRNEHLVSGVHQPNSNDLSNTDVNSISLECEGVSTDQHLHEPIVMEAKPKVTDELKVRCWKLAIMAECQ
jgi:hypothetical protein